MIIRLALLCCWATAGICQQVVLLDYSDSMAGFAGPHQLRLTGLMQRVGNSLLSAGPVQFYAVRSPSHKSKLVPLSINEGALSFSNPTSFGGYSPLRWAVKEAITVHGARDILFFTDGMEDDARVEDVGKAFAAYASEGWQIGIASMELPFQGIYYAEMKIPFTEFRPSIEREIRRRDPNAKVVPAACTEHPTATCYRYTGPRVLLMLILSRTNSLDRVLGVITDSCRQLMMSPPNRLALSPVSEPSAELQPVIPPASQRHIRKPVAGNNATELECVQEWPEPLPVTLRIAMKNNDEDASIGVVGQPTIRERPNWLRHSERVMPSGNGQFDHNIDLVCLAPSFLDSLGKPSMVLPGRIRLEYPIARQPRTQGWWIDQSASNPWQFPHLVYQLREFVNAMLFLSPEKNRTSLRYDITLRSRR